MTVPEAQRALPEGYVVTPHGLMHRSCVRRIAPGERISADGIITHANGNREKLPNCKYPRLNLHTLEPIVPGTGASLTGGKAWVETAYWMSPSALGFLSASFQVPSAPSSNGATIFFFPGAEPGDGTPLILQSVLQYGPSAAGGGNYWAAASWYCCPSNNSHYSSLINVNTGDTVLGTMTATCSSSGCNWSIVTSDTTQVTSTTLSADNVPSLFLNFGGALEAHKVDTCSQYPAAGTITFSKIVLKDQSGKPMQPTWMNDVVSGVSPSCGFNVQSTATTVTLTY